MQYVWTVLVCADDGYKTNLTIIADKCENAVVLAVAHAMTAGMPDGEDWIDADKLKNVRAVAVKCGCPVAEVQSL